MTAASILIAAGVWWLASGPISLNVLTPYLQEALAESDSPYRLVFRDTVLAWAGWDRRIDLSIREVKALAADGTIVAKAPEIAVSLSVPALLRGLIAPTSLEVIAPTLRLIRAADGTVGLDLGAGGAAAGTTMPFLADLLDRPDPTHAMGYLTRLGVVGARVSLADRPSGTTWEATGVTLTFLRDEAGITADGGLDLALGKHAVHLKVDGRYRPDDGTVRGAARFASLTPAWLADRAPALAPLVGVRVPVSGRIEATLGAAGALDRLAFALDAGAGTIDPAPWVAGAFAEAPFAVRSVRLVGDLAPAAERLRLTELTVDAGGPTLSAKGTVTGFTPRPAVALSASLAALPIDDLGRYWPRTVGPDTRAWVLANLRHGVIEKAVATLDLKPDDYAAERLPADAVHSEITLKGVTIDYFAPLPPIEGASGTVTISGRDLEATLSRGHLRGLVLERGSVGIRDMGHADDTSVVLDVAGPLADAVAVLAHPAIGFAQAVGLGPEGIAGKARGRIAFRFPLLRGSGFDNVTVSATARLTDVAARHIVDGYDVSGGAFSLSLDNAGMLVAGKAAINGIPARLTWQEIFAADAPVRRRYTVSAELGDSTRRGLGIPGGAYIAGPTPVDLDLAIAPDGRRSWRVAAVLDAARLRLPLFDWEKKAGVAGLVSVVAHDGPKGPLTIDTVTLSAADLFVEARARLGSDGGLMAATITRFALGANELRAAVVREAGGYRLRITGDRLDLRPVFADGRWLEKRNGVAPPDLVADLDVARVLVTDRHVLEPVSGTLEASGGEWRSASLRGRLDGRAAVDLALTPGTDGRVLRLRAGDAGRLLRTLDLFDDMAGGKLAFRIAVDRPRRPGVLVIENFRVRRAPLLAKLLSLASLGGFFDLLKGEGLPFTRLVIPFAYEKDRIVLDEARAYGAALGLTAKGEIAPEAGRIALAGTLVPAYTLNSLLGKLPILGKLLVPEKGGGIFAIAYAVGGSLDDPRITVNPLSALAPGLLQNLFSAVPGETDDGTVGAESTGR